METLLRNAGAAMYQAKSVERGGFQYCSPDTLNVAHDRIMIETGLGAAVLNRELTLHYQLQRNLRDTRICGMEALMRWVRSDGRAISPATFIPVAEETGLIRSLGSWALEQACDAARSWIAAGGRSLTLGVNVSAHQLHDAGFAASVEKVLWKTGFPVECLELEMTESALMSNDAGTLSVLERLKDLGVKIAIDDFGTGYSSLSYLSRLPVDRLKIDGSFVRRMGTDARNAAIVQSIVSLGHGLGMRVIAEGVETREQRDALELMGCDEAQGYFFSEPVPAGEIPHLLGE
jgi:EAL domain-containing protein (putative c-di-GMP-specific phosphodiesterase class I)